MINTNDFILLAGNPKTWDEETVTRYKKGEELIRIQEDQFERGRRSAELVRKNIGWCIRSGMTLDPETFVRCKEGEEPADHYETRTEAVVDGKAWAEMDEDNREFYALKSYFEEYDEDGSRLDDDD